MDNSNIYERYDWESLKADDLKEKALLTRRLIPDSVKSILDVGCGNGAITNYLAEYYDVTGLDRSLKALEFVSGKKIQASADSIPLPNNAIDMGFSSELLEHLEDEVLLKTVSELKRVSRDYILISVPNNENPGKLSIKCPNCNHIFNSSNHLQVFTTDRFSRLFPEYELVASTITGKKVRYYNRFLLNMKLKISPSSSWIPYFWIPESKRNAFCPACEYEFKYLYKFCLVSSIIDILNVIISPKKPYWLIVLFKKKVDQ
jgi:SAM-dependent methyltransferase